MTAPSAIFVPAWFFGLFTTRTVNPLPPRSHFIGVGHGCLSFVLCESYTIPFPHGPYLPYHRPPSDSQVYLTLPLFSCQDYLM